jgi:hypothetical protein
LVLPSNDLLLALPGLSPIFKPPGSPKPAARKGQSESRASPEMETISTACSVERAFEGRQ